MHLSNTCVAFAVDAGIAPAVSLVKRLLAENAGTRVLGFNYDTGERYLSVPDFLPTE